MTVSSPTICFSSAFTVNFYLPRCLLCLAIVNNKSLWVVKIQVQKRFKRRFQKCRKQREKKKLPDEAKRSVLVTWLSLEPSADFSTFLITTSPAPTPARPFCVRSSLCCRSSCRRVSRSFSLWSGVEERREGTERRDREVERWCKWKKRRRRRTKGPKQTDSTSSDWHKDGLKQGFQIWSDTFQDFFFFTVP